MESRKTVPKNLFSEQQERNRHRNQTYGHGEKGGEGEIYGESNMETYITICKIDRHWEFAVCFREFKWALYQLRWMGWEGRCKGGSRGRCHTYTYD